MLTNEERKEYLDYLIQMMVENYKIKNEEAKKIIENSSVNKMIYSNDEEDAFWVMRYPIESIMKIIYLNHLGASQEFIQLVS